MLPFEFLFNEQYLTNILSFAVVASKFRITINAELEPSINLNLNDGTRMVFKQCDGCLYHFDTTNNTFS